VKLNEIKKQMVAIPAAMATISRRDLQSTVVKLLGLLDSCIAVADRLEETVQLKDDEINRLKGEDGRAQFKGAGASSHSSEKERKTAEGETDPPETGFRLTREKLDALRENAIPDHLLVMLENLKNKAFKTEIEFMEAVTGIIGAEEADKHRQHLLKHGLYKKRKRPCKVPGIEINRTEICEIDKTALPADAIKTGYEENVVQDIKIERDNVLFRKETYYSPSEKKTYTAEVPVGYEGGYGPSIKTEIVIRKYDDVMSEPKILNAFRAYGVIISSSYISNRLISPEHIGIFLDEKDDLFTTALAVSKYHQIDDTGCIVNGVNHYVHILCNPCYTAYFTMPRKDRLTILDILRNFQPRRFLFNEDTFRYLDMFNVSGKTIAAVAAAADENEYDEDRLGKLLTELFTDHEQGKITRSRIMEAAAIAHYRQGSGNEIIDILIADDAPQFKLLTAFLALCWVHAGRHFKKLNPLVPCFQKALEKFQSEFWEFYGKLSAYQKNPAEAEIEILEKGFDLLFSCKTGYPDLDERIEKTLQKKKELLLVLKHPEIPLHNNRSENGARVQKRREDVSFQTRNANGTKAKDAMMSVIETCKKLGVNTREYIKDRILKSDKIPRLSDLIRRRVSN
jgi:hypothetical protein